MSEKIVADSAYRADDAGLQLRLTSLLAKREEARADIADILKVIRLRRARIAAGRCSIVGVMATALVGLGEVVAYHEKACQGYITLSLVATIASSLLVYWWLASNATKRDAKEVEDLVSGTSDLRRDIARLESDSDLWEKREAAASLESRSVSVPMIGAGALIPITLHLVVGLFIGLIADVKDFQQYFDGWILLSVVLTAAAHASLFYRSRRFAERLLKTPDAKIIQVSSRYGWGTFGWVVLYGCLPGAILWLIPVVLVAITAVLIVPALFVKAGGTVAHERLVLGLAPFVDRSQEIAPGDDLSAHLARGSDGAADPNASGARILDVDILAPRESARAEEEARALEESTEAEQTRPHPCVT